MATEAQILANRSNARKSTGPISREGKAVISQNAVKHGLLARQAVISAEKKADFDLYRDRILNELAPETPMEYILAERIVILSWRLTRAGRIQAQTIDAMNEDNKSRPLTKLTQSLLSKRREKSRTAQPPEADDLALGRLAIKDFSHARVLDRLLMYERRIENSLYKTILEFQRLSLMRNLDNTSGNNEQTTYPAQIVNQL